MRTLRFSIIVDMKGVEKGGFLEYPSKYNKGGTRKPSFACRLY